MRYRRTAARIVAMLAALALPQAASVCAETAFALDPATTYQTCEGWGGSADFPSSRERSQGAWRRTS